MEPSMTIVLHIDASLDPARSNTRRLGTRFVQAWQRSNPHGTVLRRDLAEKPAPALSAAFVGAVKKPPDERNEEEREAWAVSEELSAEFLSADRYVFGLPMHILTVPSVFKSYVEQIFHEERVFRTDATGFHGLLGGRKCVFLLSKGADYRPGAPLAPYDMLEPYLLKLFSLCGVDRADMTFVSVNNALSPNGPEQSDREGAESRIEELAAKW
jgi:FMN-dependent NADH-azoreductase